MLRPTPGRLRAVLRQAGKIRTRPRPSASITPSLTPSLSPIRGHTRLHTHHAISHLSSGSAMRMASRRCFSSHTAARSVSSRGSATLAAFVKSVLRHAVKAVRTGLAKQRLHPHTLFQVLKSVKLASYQVRSPLLNGAINAFRSTAKRTSNQATRSAYAQLNTPSLAFSRGALSGFGPRPAAGPLALSPLRGGMGLQTARKFSSGGARVFDNLIVNAPLALRLASDEVEEKAKLARRKPTSSPRRVTAVAAGARRTGPTFSAAKLPHHAYAFATATKPTQPTATSISSVDESTSTASELEFELSSYFQFPELPLTPLSAAAASTIVSIRLIDPLFDALGGRDPTPPDPGSGGPRLFDAAFLVDANTALEYEHRRYLRAKAVLRVLRDTGLLTDACAMNLSDPALWTISMVANADDVRRVLNDELDFEFETWCSVTTFAEAEESQSEHDSLLDTPRTRSSDAFDTLSLPSLASSQEGEFDAEREHTSSNAASGSVDDELVSLPGSESFRSESYDSSGGGSLYDSRTWR